MTIADIVAHLSTIAPPSLQEDYDNSGLLTGDPAMACTGVLCTLDVTGEVIAEAITKGCNCIVAHHPLIFRGLKRLSGGTQVEKTLIQAIKNDIAIYACHTNIDNVIHGVNAIIAERVGLAGTRVLQPREGLLMKLFTFVPPPHLETVRQALFAAGAGQISDYSECSFITEGRGTFKPGEQSNPYLGTRGERQEENEVKLEVILPAYRQKGVVDALQKAHPYEEVAYDLISLGNAHQGTGSGLIGELPEPCPAVDFLQLLKDRFDLSVVRHTAIISPQIRKVAVCGGAGSFLIKQALAAGADAYVTADLKYHEFFDAEGRMLLCDIGHYESEQFTKDLFVRILVGKFPTFAILKSEIKTNPVSYFTGK